MASEVKRKDEITHLDFPDNVRTRPTMYIGSCGLDGLHHCFLEILHNSIDEHAAGFCKRIVVDLVNARTIRVTDDGRGIPVAVHSTAGVSQLELALTKLHAGSKFFQSGDKFSSGMNGVGASCVNALSSKFTAHVRRGGKTWMLSCTQGRLDTKEVKEVKRAFPFKSGTCIEFSPDDAIFEQVKFSPNTIREMVKDAAYLNPGLIITLNVEGLGKKFTYHYRQGLKNYVDDMVRQSTSVVNKYVSIRDEGSFTDRRDHKFRYKMSCEFTYVKESVKDLRSFVNNVRTNDGGTHEEGFYAGVTRAVLRMYKAREAKISGVTEIKPSDVIDSGIVGVLSFYMQEPRFASQTKKKLTNAEAAPAVTEAVADAFHRYLRHSPTYTKAILARVAENAKRRERGEDTKAAKKLIKKDLHGKLVDCVSKDPRQCELWIVEGDSAGGTAVKSRDAKTQAILPLRGKILNIEKATTRKALAHQEIQNLISAIGTGVCVGNNDREFDIDKLNYHKIIIATDADVDGGHIRALLLTFFFRFMRPLLVGGYIYSAVPPLYLVTKGRGRNEKRRYFYDAATHERFLNRRLEKGYDNTDIVQQRYKGLGEMSADQFESTTMNPESRVLKQFTCFKPNRTEKLVELLMGQRVEERRQFIIDNALNANLDI